MVLSDTDVLQSNMKYPTADYDPRQQRKYSSRVSELWKEVKFNSQVMR